MAIPDDTRVANVTAVVAAIVAAALGAGVSVMAEMNSSITTLRQRINVSEDLVAQIPLMQQNQQYNRERLRELEQALSADVALSTTHKTRIDLMLEEIQRLRQFEIGRCEARNE